jgi:RecA-family ATPase
MNAPFLDLQSLARALGGKISGGQILAPGPGHKPADRSLSVKLDSSSPDGFVVHSFSADDPITCRDYVREKIGAISGASVFDDDVLGAPPDDDLPEVPADVADEIAMWRRIIGTANPENDIHDLLRNAAAALFAVRKKSADPIVAQAIVDALADMAVIAEIGGDDAQLIFAEADADATLGKPAQVNGHAVDEPPLATGPEDYGTAVPATIDERPLSLAPVVLTTPAQWPQEAPPPVDWLAHGRIPRGDVTTLHGDGGAGKTDIALRLAANVARGAVDWLSQEIANGPVVLVSAEEPEREVRRRIWQHGLRDGYTFDDLAELHQWFPDTTGDTVLATPDYRTGIMRPTRLMHSIAAAIEQVAPVLVVVDNVAATFAGNQNDRVMVRSFVNLWRTIARGPSKAAVLLLDHPSLSGLTSGTGRGGNMDWRNAVRSALYLRSPEDKAEVDRGIRILETAKSNYGAPGNPLRLQWADGGLQLEHAPTSLHRLAKDAECGETFLRLLDERNAQARPVSDKSGKNYAPAVFAEMRGNGGFTAKAFARAMDRLFETRTITLRPERRDGKTRDVIDRANAANEPPSEAA